MIVPRLDLIVAFPGSSQTNLYSSSYNIDLMLLRLHNLNADACVC